MMRSIERLYGKDIVMSVNTVNIGALASAML